MFNLRTLSYYYKVFFLLLVIGIIVKPISTCAQVKPYGRAKGLFQGAMATDGKLTYLLEAKQLTYDNGICGYFNKLLMPVATSATPGNTGLLGVDFSIQNNHFIQSKKTVTDVLQECNTVNLWIDKAKRGAILNNHFEQPLVISGLSGTLTINGNQIPYMMFSDAVYGDINLSGNTIVSNVHFSQTKYGKVEIMDNVFKKDTARVDVMHSSLRSAFIMGNKAKVLNVYFTTDTIGMLEIWTGNLFEPETDRQINEISFFHCRLNDLLTTDFTKKMGKRSIRFNECDFSKEVSLLDVSADTIEFTNCLQIESGMYLRALKKKNPTILKFYRTDLNNIDFDYDSRYQLYQSPDADQNRSVYEKLLVKFQNEKKLASYERVDKEYFQSRHGIIVNTLNLIWWDFGYNKWLIIVWSLFFLLLFTLFNYWHWNDLLLTYPIKRTDIATTDTNIELAIKIFIYTAVIFFSLKVDFDKLSFKRSAWLVYFFVQYMTGLLCLFFIANAILKL